jgi:hypothetical protein
MEKANMGRNPLHNLPIQLKKKAEHTVGPWMLGPKIQRIALWGGGLMFHSGFSQEGE